jgi:Fur family transcriptional regulator, ferric uptake regulator
MTGHFSLEDLTRRLALDGVRLSQATIYRSLPLLEEAGVIRRALHLQTTARDGVVFEHVDETHHDHLVCSTCGHTVEFEYPAIEVLQEAVAREHGFVLQRHHMELVGICATCRGAISDNSSGDRPTMGNPP